MREIPKEKRTLANWASSCLQILHAINIEYSRNPCVKGRFIEFIRVDDAGLYVSHSFVKIRDCYYLSFALLFSKSDSARTNHPLMAGSRFDHNYTIYRQFEQELGLTRVNPKWPKGIWSFAVWRKNTMDDLRVGLTLPEIHLYPHYRMMLAKGKKRLISLFRRAAQILGKGELSGDISLDEFSDIMKCNPNKIIKTRNEAIALDAGKIAVGGDCHYELNPFSGTFFCDDVSFDSIIFNNWDVFYLEKSRIEDIILIVESL